MKISEKDIFNFVYYPGKLKEEIKNYIFSNRKLFEEEIRLCQITKNGLTGEYAQLKNLIILDKMPALELNQQPKYLIAADSINLKKSVKTETYVNKENRIFAKAVFYKDKTRVFVYSEDSSIPADFKIILKPSDLSFIIDSGNEPIDLPAGLEIDSIYIER